MLSPARTALVALILFIGGLWLAIAGAYQYLEPDLPDVATLSDMRLQVPLRVYSRDGRLIAQIGEQRRIPLRYEEFPKPLINAVLAAEDDQFFSHSGVDYPGLARSTLRHLLSGERAEGGSTITMQLTRGVFLSSEKSYRRKLAEIFLTLRIERIFSKPEILSLYLNKMFLGQRAYGAGAAAEVYFGKTIDRLTLSEVAIVAGTFRSPSRDNPVASAELARQRRSYVLRRMHEKDFISKPEYEAALVAPIESKLHGPAAEVDAPYAAEMVRVEMLNRYGPRAYTDGYRVVTSIDSQHQQAAVASLRIGLIEYDRRHGYRGPVAHVAITPSSKEADYLAALTDYSALGGLKTALILAVNKDGVEALTRENGPITLDFANLRWAKPALADGSVGKAPEQPGDILSAGDIVYVAQDTAGTWHLLQAPEAQAAFVALDPQDGAISALTGGYDYYASNYNRAVQAKRQPGSSFKPLLYSAALEYGFTPASVINDSPIVLDDASLEGSWRPQNNSREFLGPMRLREALVRSRNLVSIRIMNELGTAKATQHMQGFGFTPEELPQNLSLALGTTQVSPLSMARAYAVFANGGYRIDPYLIDRIEDADGKLLYAARPKIACRDCGNSAATATTDSAMASNDVARWGSNRYLDSKETSKALQAPLAISPQNAYLMTDIMADVIRRGTATRALELKRSDLAGKTGTSQDQRDAWFCGFNAGLVGVVWVGFDQERSLGPREQGGTTALPIWVAFMAEALRGQPERRLSPPLGLVNMRISTVTGKAARPGEENTILETFMSGHLPEGSGTDANAPLDTPSSDRSDEPIF
ncbi:MAG: penicillin-binding protein 1A [Candidatus Obscuribacterales bacterium]|nr:penicillin-binding protein 1A [Steroidobacteraceae bacterium]